MGVVTLAFEELLLHPRFGEMVRHFRNIMPTGLRDQIDAAAIETHDGLHQMRDSAQEGKVAAVGADSVGDWLRLGVIDALVAHCTGTAVTCAHNPHPAFPQPLLAAAWKPGLVVCGDCVHLLSLPKRSAANFTCDACGHVCAGDAAGDPLFIGASQLGPLLYRFGTCAACRVTGNDGAPL